MYQYRSELKRKNFDIKRFHEFKSFIENNLRESNYYTDYTTQIGVFEEFIKNGDVIKHHLGFHCNAHNVSGEVHGIYQKMEDFINNMKYMNICTEPAGYHGGGFYVQIVDTEKFYNFLCNELEELTVKIIKYLQPPYETDAIQSKRKMFSRVDDEFIILEQWLNSNKPTDFEKAITYLLSLYGYDTIHVGDDFEKATLLNRRKKHGKSSISIDVFAFFENMTIICQCSIDPHFRKIPELLDIYSELKLSTGSSVIIPVIATPLSQDLISGTILEANNKGIKFLTHEGINELFTGVKEQKKNHPQAFVDTLI